MSDEKDNNKEEELVGFFNKITAALVAACAVQHTKSGKTLPLSMTPYECVFTVLGVGTTQEHKVKQRDLLLSQQAQGFPGLVDEFVDNCRSVEKKKKKEK